MESECEIYVSGGNKNYGGIERDREKSKIAGTMLNNKLKGSEHLEGDYRNNEEEEMDAVKASTRESGSSCRSSNQICSAKKIRRLEGGIITVIVFLFLLFAYCTYITVSLFSFDVAENGSSAKEQFDSVKNVTQFFFRNFFDLLLNEKKGK